MIARRTVLLSSLVLAAAGPARALAVQPDLSLNDFLVLSASLTGHDPSTLDLEAAQALHLAFLTQGQGRALLALLALAPEPAAATPAGRSLLRAWYTGIVDTAQGPQVVAGKAPLVWRSAAFLHPPGTCGGLTGYWASAPAT